jgi:hypothetical protein
MSAREQASSQRPEKWSPAQNHEQYQAVFFRVCQLAFTVTVPPVAHRVAQRLDTASYRIRPSLREVSDGRKSLQGREERNGDQFFLLMDERLWDGVSWDAWRAGRRFSGAFT